MELTNRIPHMMTVRQVAKTGLISEYALRQLVKQGKVPCIALLNTRCLSILTHLLNSSNS